MEALGLLTGLMHLRTVVKWEGTIEWHMDSKSVIDTYIRNAIDSLMQNGCPKEIKICGRGSHRHKEGQRREKTKSNTTRNQLIDMLTH
jgi:hypothetical protein